MVSPVDVVNMVLASDGVAKEVIPKKEVYTFSSSGVHLSCGRIAEYV